MRIRLVIRDEEARAALKAKKGAMRAAIDRFRGLGGQYVRGVMVAVIRELQKQGKGTLSNSVQWFPTAKGFVVAATAAHAPFVDKPTRPHLIRPVRAKALAFPRAGGVLTRSRSTGHVRTRFTFGGRTVTTAPVFARVVHHPGTRGMDFTGETARRVPDGLTAILMDSVARSLEDA